MTKIGQGLGAVIFVAVVLGIFIFGSSALKDHFDKKAAEKAAEEKRVAAEYAAYDKLEAEIQAKQLKVVSAHLKLPEENVMMLDTYDNDFGDYDESEEYSVVAKGVEYVVSFDKDITKLDKFVELPKSDSEDSSDDSTDSDDYDDDGAHFPKIKTKRSTSIKH